MKQILMLCSILFLQSNLLNAQHRSCASHDVHLQQLQNDPSYAANRLKIEEQTERFVQQNKQVRGVKTIPVVFHIVYRTATENISDAQIMSQLNILNADFRKLNSDWLNTPIPFQATAADCEIQFCLAQQDPNGNPTTGIVRVPTSVTSFSSNNAVKYTAQGGSNIWDRSRYLNIWVCNLGGGLLGYAQFPGGASATDGVVINYNATGNVGTAAAPYNKGRTATHEVGHWLNLFHIWGDDGTGCNGSDLVGDTPNQGGPNYGCPSFPKLSCTNGPDGDMHMNYMDYTDDACMYMFTAGQKARIDALFTVGGARAALLTSNGCTPPAVALCGTPSNVNAGSISTNSATISWGSVSGALSYTLEFKLSSDTIWNALTTTSTSAVLSNLNPSSTYNVRVSATCTDSTSNWSSAISFSTSAVGPVCTNTFESNNTRNTATLLAVNNTVSSMINSSTDRDYYRFTTTNAAPKLQVTLSNLPADYDIRLYASNGTTQLGISQLSGTSTEIIKYNTSKKGATYYVQVYGYNGAFNANGCYSLTVNTSSANFKESEISADVEKSDIDIYPNPANQSLNVRYFAEINEEVAVRLINRMGQTVYSAKTQTYSEGENHLKINTHDLADGLYFIEMIQGEERKVGKIQITH
ncbi:MAG: M43 family zinc metalloprotease [Chitinophagaceae bacterium]